MASLAAVYRLALRATQGLLGSVMQLLKVKLAVPAYTTLCWWCRALAVNVPRHAKGKSLHVVVKSTGFKVYEGGEWKVRSHSWSRRRPWRRLHIGVDEVRGEIVATAARSNDLTNGQLFYC
jgi:hypothetical protein